MADADMAMRSGNVAGMVSQLNTAIHSSVPFRHGSAAREPSTSRDRTGSGRSQSATAATRERDRLRRNDPGLTPQFVRLNAAGPKETRDWLPALVDVQDRIESLERVSRLHAQTISAQQDEHKCLYNNT